jgi:hypothetical protein
MHIVIIAAVAFLAANFLLARLTSRPRRRSLAWRWPVLSVAALFAVCAFGAIGVQRLPFTITVIPADPSLSWVPAKTLSGLLQVGAVASGLILFYLTLRELLRIGFGVAGWLQRRLS